MVLVYAFSEQSANESLHPVTVSQPFSFANDATWSSAMPRLVSQVWELRQRIIGALRWHIKVDSWYIKVE